MIKKVIIAVIILIAISAAGYKYIYNKNHTAPAEKDIASLYESFVLKNGMRVFVVPNNAIPAVSHMVWYRVGGKDEQVGKSGITHLLEHLMFKGTAKFPKGEFSKAVSESGGQENAFTAQDYTGFYQNVPTEKLGLMMEMEADRMNNLRFDDSEFETERDVVMEEYRMRVTNSPRALMTRELDAALYRNHPYRTQVIGWENEILALKPEDAFHYYHKYYDPKNAILVVAGDTDVETVKVLASKHYGSIPGNYVEKRIEIIEPPRVASAKIVYEDERVAQKEFWQKFIAPSYTAADEKELKKAFALEVFARLLGGGTSSILYKELVVKQGAASAAGSGYNGYHIGPSEFIVYAYPAAGISDEKLQKMIAAEILKVQKGKVNKKRLAAVKKSMIAEQIYEREGLQQIAYRIAQNYIIGLEPEFITEWEVGIAAVTAEDISAVAQQILQQEKSVIGVLQPKKLEVK